MFAKATPKSNAGRKLPMKTPASARPLHDEVSRLFLNSMETARMMRPKSTSIRGV